MSLYSIDTAIEICREIIDEYSFPPVERRHHPKSISAAENDEDVNDNLATAEIKEKIYVINNFIIRVTWCDGGINDSGIETGAQVLSQKLSKNYGHGDLSTYSPC